jgi:RNA polymerase sigma-70 factor (ECF subfamily)
MYWQPCYAWLRSSGKSQEDAEDLVQGFFAYVMTRAWLAKANQERGRFRSFLLKSLRNYVSDRRKYDDAQKRGGGIHFVSADLAAFEDTFASFKDAPDVLFDRQWALLTLEQAFEILKERYLAENQENLFVELSPFIEWNSGSVSQAEAAKKLGMKPGAFRVALKRLRGRMRMAIEEQVAQTVTSKEELETEINHLIQSL